MAVAFASNTTLATSVDGVVVVTLTVNQEADGVYALVISTISPALVPLAVELGSKRVWQGPGRTDAGS